MGRVVITGIGAVTPLGNSFSESWETLKAGKTGLGPVTGFDASGIPWKVAGELKGFDPSLFVGRKNVRRTDPFVHYAVAAAIMAGEDSGLIEASQGAERADRHDCEKRNADYLDPGGVIIGSSRAGISTIERALLTNFAVPTRSERRSPLRLSPYLMPATTTSMAASYSAQALGVRGHCLGISNACSSGLNAIGEAFRLLRSGWNGPVFAGGTEAPVCRLCVEGYGACGALSRGEDPSASRPFSEKRDGFVIAEGACIMVLERLDEAVRRNARIYGEVIGYANTTDAFHQTRPDVRGEARAMRQAMADAAVIPEDIDYVNAHGTSTILGDRAEAEALAMVFGRRISRIPVSAAKSVTGHMLAASGALEAAFTAMSLKEGVIPPSINVSAQDKSCNIALVKQRTRKKMRLALTNSFGFGGVNAVLVMKGFL